MHNVVIIGSGCAGNTAAVYAARAVTETACRKRAGSGRTAFSITSEVENFPGFPDGHYRTGTRREHEGAGRTLRRTLLRWRGHRSRSLETPVPAQNRRRLDRNPHADRRIGRQSALAGSAFGTEAHRPRRQFVRHLRRLLLSREGNHGGGRRRFRHGRSELPDALRPPRGAGSSPRYLPRVEDHV